MFVLPGRVRLSAYVTVGDLTNAPRPQVAGETQRDSARIKLGAVEEGIREAAGEKQRGVADPKQVSSRSQVVR